MGYVEKSLLRNYLHDSTAIDSHRKHDPLEPSLYSIVDLVNGYPHESGGQITQQLLEINCCLRLVSTILQVRSQVLLSGSLKRVVIGEFRCPLKNRQESERTGVYSSRCLYRTDRCEKSQKVPRG
jgi:hypothetical protein